MLVVGFDPSENIDMIRQYKESKEYSWIFAEYNKEALLHFKVITQSTKIGINTKGNIVFNEGYGVTDNDGWRRMLERLE